MDQSFGGATWSPAGLWRRQLELLPGVNSWNEPLGKQAIGIGPPCVITQHKAGKEDDG
jgi:hypothetical protein